MLKDLLDQIETILTGYHTKLRLRGSQNKQDINIEAEYLVLDLLNILFDYNFVNLNDLKFNSAGADLADVNKNVYVQVSTTDTHGKIQSSLDHIQAQGHLIFFHLGMESANHRNFSVPTGISFNPKNDVLNFGWVIKNSHKHAEEILQCLEKHCGFADGSAGLFERLSKALEQAIAESGSYRLQATEQEIWPELITSFQKLNGQCTEAGGDEILLYDYISALQDEGVIIEGAGGIGKTVQLQKIGKELLANCKPAVFIPLHMLDSKTIDEYIYQKVLRNDSRLISLFDREKVVLLLDGFNEVAANFRDNLRREILYLKRSNDKVPVVSTRTVGSLQMSGMQHLVLQPIPESKAYAWLKDNSIEISNEKVIKILKTPLMLLLYRSAHDILSRKNNLLTSIHNETNEGTIIWSFAQAQLEKYFDLHDTDTFNAIIAVEYVLPFIAWKMFCDDQYVINFEQILLYLDEFCESFSEKDLPRTVYSEMRHQHLKIDISKESISRIITDELKLIETSSEDHPTNAFAHQNFRDCFAAIHLLHLAALNIQKNNDEIPLYWKETIKRELIVHLVHLLPDEQIQSMWNDMTLRPCAVNLTNNLVKIMRARYHDDFTQIDFRKRDLRSVILRNGVQLQSNHFEEAKISSSTFLKSGHSGAITTVSLSADGKVCMSYSVDSTVMIWDTDNGRLLGITTADYWDGGIVFMSPEGILVIYEKKKNAVQFMNAYTGSPMFNINVFNTNVTTLDLLENICAYGTEKGELFIFDINEKKQIHTIQVGNKPITCVNISGNGTIGVCNEQDSILRFYNIDGQLIQQLNCGDERVDKFSISYDGKLCASISNNSQVKIWNVEKGFLQKILEGHTEWTRAVWLSSNGELCVSGSVDRTILIHDIETEEILHTLHKGADVVTAVCLSKNMKICASGSFNGTFQIWDVENGELIHTLEGNSDYTQSISLSSDAKVCASIPHGNELKIWDVEKGILINSLCNTKDFISPMCLSGDGKICASGVKGNSVQVWDILKSSIISTIEGSSSLVLSMCLSNDGSICIIGASDNEVRIWDTVKGNIIQTLNQHENWITSVGISTDQKMCISGSDDGIVLVCDIATGRVMHRFNENNSTIFSVKFSVNGDICASASRDQIVFWDVSDGKLIYRLKGFSGDVRELVLSKEGNVCTAWTSDMNIYIWNVNDKILIKTFNAQELRMRTAGLSLDGRICVIGADDNILYFVDLSSENYFHKCLPIFGVNLIGCDFTGVDFDGENQLAHIIHTNGGIGLDNI